jgi:hypothetical protein
MLASGMNDHTTTPLLPSPPTNKAKENVLSTELRNLRLSRIHLLALTNSTKALPSTRHSSLSTHRSTFPWIDHPCTGWAAKTDCLPLKRRKSLGGQHLFV